MDKKDKEDCSTKDEDSIPIQCSSISSSTEMVMMMMITKRQDSIPDDTELPSVPALSDDGDSNEEHSVTSSGPKGLRLLVQECFGKPLDKSQQLSDWERRPLKPEQMYYAGITCWQYMCMCIGNFRGSNFRGLGSSDDFMGLYFHGVPTLTIWLYT